MAAKNTNVRWLLNFRIHVFLESTLFLVILISFSASGIASLTGSETPGTAGIMDIGAATAGLYSVPIFNVPPSAGMQAAAQLSAPNPNATSPRPSILRKRTSEGYVGIFS